MILTIALLCSAVVNASAARTHHSFGSESLAAVRLAERIWATVNLVQLLGRLLIRSLASVVAPQLIDLMAQSHAKSLQRFLHLAVQCSTVAFSIGVIKF